MSARLARLRSMPDRSPLDILPADLPPGRLVQPDPEFAEDKWTDRPVLWVSDETVDSEVLIRQWSRFYAARHETGLYPLLLQGLNGQPERPWHVGELSPLPVGAIDALTVSGVLRRFWSEVELLADDADENPENPDPRLGEEDLAGGGLAEDVGERDGAGVGRPGGGLTAVDGVEHDVVTPVRPPYDGWPGLAPAHEIADAAAPDEAALACVTHYAELADQYLGLVPAPRGADALSLCGWDGPCNHGHTQEISAVIRSWEDRFGVRVVVVGFDTLILSVAAPPATVAQARHIAAEHHAFCPDNILQGGQDFEEYARSLVGEPRWYFWWD